MAARSERQKSKLQEKYQMILSQMLKEEDNKYCVDCDTKSPRWACWNTGVFICIRCAGFHRNLGVHISKVKSINLDTWTGEQIASVQAMGNSRARAVYEANLPDGFRRPQTDSALESFIRAKYEQRKWIAKEWIPPEISVLIDLIESETNQRRVEPTTVPARTEKDVSKLKPFPAPNRQTVQPFAAVSIEGNKTRDLLNLDEPSMLSSTKTINSSDIPSLNILDSFHEIFTTRTVSQTKYDGNPSVTNDNQDSDSAFTSANQNGMMSNEKIMALFNIPQIPVTGNLETNIRPSSSMQHSTVSSSGFVYPPAQHSHLLPHHKSISFGSNLYQQPSNFSFPTQHNDSSFGKNGNHPNGMNTPTLQSPASSLAQLNIHRSQLMPVNVPAGTLPSSIPLRSVAEYMPASSDSLWH